MEHLSQSSVVGQSGINKSLVEAGNRTTIHFVVYPVAAVHPYDGGLVTIGIGVRPGATKCLRPVCGEALDVLRVEAVAERMADHFVGHYPAMPGLGEAAQTADAARRIEDSAHTGMITKHPCPGKANRANAPRTRRSRA